MNSLLTYIKGDKYLWAAIIFLSLFSFLPVYSASSNLQFIVGSGTTTSHIIKHASFIIIGICFVFIIQNIDYKYFGAFAVIALPFVVFALLLTLLQGTTIDGANAARWLKIPGTSIAFQSSVFASLTLLVYISRYLTKNKDIKITLAKSIMPLFFPILIIIGLILPANGSMAVIIFATVMILLFVGGFPLKYLALIILSIILCVTFFIAIVLSFPEKFENISRVKTWQNRIERFNNNEVGLEDYQVMNAKAAIVDGGTTGVGPGKSSFKQVLPQSASDFIFAIVIEEYGLWGALILIFLFLFILFRVVVIATKIHTYFGTLLVFACGFPICFQALLNMGVAVNLLPVTGQPLPLISYGGTSMWVTYIALGIIISVSTQIKSPEELEIEKKKQSEAIIEDIA